MKTERLSLADRLQRAWYQGAPWLPLLYPLSWLVASVARRRLRQFRAADQSPPLPVVVVGNVTVGGTGKTPVVVALCELFSARGHRVAVISRGYGARAPRYPWPVDAEGDARFCGDEPLLVAQRTGVPVVIDAQRSRALAFVQEHYAPDVVISDDGMQHYALPRSLEIAVVDGARGLGNGRCVPAGPLREPAERLADVDWVVLNGLSESTFANAVVMTLDSADPVNIVSGESMPIEDFMARRPFLHAVAGIGNPERFFVGLEGMGLRIERHAFPDHHAYAANDFQGFAGETVLMTEKDAVKCRALASPDWWYLPVTARLPTVLLEDVYDRCLKVSP